MEQTLATGTLSINNLLKNLMAQGLTEARKGNHKTAYSFFQKILKLDEANEKAMMWCAMLCADPFDAKVYLQELMARRPEDKLIRTYYGLAVKRCEELDQLLKESDLLQRWSRNEGGVGEISRLGDYLVKVGTISQQQLGAALHFQNYLRQHGQEEKLGEILLSFGYINKRQLQKALEFQRLDFFSRFND
jgi:hypothetical protein